MIYGFLPGVTYHNEFDAGLYFTVTATIQWNEHWEVKGVWYISEGDHKYKEDRIVVAKTDLKAWYYGKYGPC